MNPIELGKAIAEVGIPIITAVLLILVVGLVWYLIKSIMGMFRNELKVLHKDSVKTAVLTKRSIVLIKNVSANQKQLCTLIEGVDNKINGRKR